MCYNRKWPTQFIVYQESEQENTTMSEFSDKQPGNTPDTEAKTGTKVGRTIGIVAAVVVLLALVGAAAYGLVTHPLVTAVLRDVAIIALALVTLLIGLFLVILIFQLQSLIALLREEIKPILESTNQTVSTVRGTTTFVTETLVQPMITAASYASALRQTVSTLSGGNRKKPRQRDGKNA
jgi:hypothetical protein